VNAGMEPVPAFFSALAEASSAAHRAQATLVIAACVMLLAALWLAASPVRALRSVPLLAPEPEPSLPIAEPNPALPL
jgi:hypothetical protein